MIPNLFIKKEIPQDIPEEMQKIIEELKKINNKEKILYKAYDILVNKYQGQRWGTFLKLPLLFITDIYNLWQRDGFLHCTAMNYLLRILLIKTGRFRDEEIELKLTLVWYISIHQYIRVKISEDKFINVDIWGANYGINFGDYAHGFH